MFIKNLSNNQISLKMKKETKMKELGNINISGSENHEEQS